MVRTALAAILASSLLLSSCSREGALEPEVRPGGPIIIVSIDTLRADRLPAWGYGGVQTPAIDSLVRDGVRFSSAWSHAPLTLPSHASVFTGRLPGDHGVRDNLGYKLDSSIPTLATILGQNGYATAGMVSSWVLRDASGIANGFQTWDDGLDPEPGASVGELQRSGNATVDSAIGWIGSRPAGKPFFLFVHLFEPHTPYSPPEPFRSRYSDPYDGEIATADSMVERLLTSLRSSGLYEDATIILMSDHGEGLGDHGEAEHGVFLYREAIHVPLIVKLAGGRMAGQTVDAPAGLADIFPTVLQVAGVKGSEAPGTASLIALAASELPAQRRIFSETMYPRIHMGWSHLTSLTDGDVHVIEAPRPELYRMSSDPGEKNNIIETERRLYADFRREIEAVATPYSPPAPVDAEEAAKLTALGYLGAGPATDSGALPDPKDRIGELQLMHEAAEAVRSGNAREAVNVYRKLLERNPLLADGWIQLAAAYEATGALPEAIAASQRAIQVAPSLAPGVALNIARLQLQTGDLEGAAQHAEIAANANAEEARLIRARVELSRRNHARAIEIATPLLAHESLRDEATVIVAQSQVGLRNPQQGLALIDSERARLLANGADLPPQMEFTRGDALMRMGRVDEALAAFGSEIERHPRNLDAYASLAAVYFLGDRPSEAEAVLRQMTQRNPGRRSFEVAADVYEKLGQQDLARQWRERGGVAGR